MRIIISPAKKMQVLEEYSCTLTAPALLERTRVLMESLRSLSFAELKTLWGCSEKLASVCYKQLHTYEIDRNLTPALLAYEGIQYQYMAPQIFSDTQWNYAEQHLRILSGFYGILKPTDGVIPYRLEMQAKIAPLGKVLQKFSSFLPGTEENTGQDSQQKLEPFPRNLYQYWGDALYRNLTAGTADEEEPFYIVNLASAEYSKAILPYVTRPVRVVTCVFGEWIAGKVKVKGTQAKMARGEMVRWMAENQVEDVQELKQFEGLGYRFHPELSSEEEYVFLK